MIRAVHSKLHSGHNLLQSGAMNSVLAITFVFVSSAVAADDPVETLRVELAGLNVTAPESDAKHDIAIGHVVCFSINGYAKYFPGVPRQDQEYCEAREKNFRGTGDVILSKEHGELISQVTKYAERYNAYILRHRK